jgi:phage host-nuclease inhibitor protein Gam
VHFLQGTAGWRTVPAAIRVTDTLAAIAYAQECLPEAVKTQAVLDREAYRAHMEETGQLLPGMEVTPEHESFRVSFGKQEE